LARARVDIRYQSRSMSHSVLSRRMYAPNDLCRLLERL
jgi:hypothetical protein